MVDRLALVLSHAAVHDLTRQAAFPAVFGSLFHAGLDRRSGTGTPRDATDDTAVSTALSSCAYRLADLVVLLSRQI